MGAATQRAKTGYIRIRQRDCECSPSISWIGETLKAGAGYVYVMKGGTPPLFKIGSTFDLHKRLHQLRAMVPHGVELVHYVKVDSFKQLETRLHGLFQSRRVNGEWFDFSPHEDYQLRELVHEMHHGPFT